MGFALRPKSKAGRIVAVVGAVVWIIGVVTFAVWVLSHVGIELWAKVDPFGRGLISGFVIGCLPPWLIHRLREH
jgi:hypothetical protein